VRRPAALLLLLLGLTHAAAAQSTVVDLPRQPLGDGPWVFDTAEQHKIKVSVLTKALQRPFGMNFLPDGTLLVTERPGRLRVIHHGQLDPTPVPGLPAINARANAGLFDVVPHPNYAQNHLLYFAYSKAGQNGESATVLARATFDGTALTNVQDLYTTDFTRAVGGTRIVFAPDGTMFLTTPAAIAAPTAPGYQLAQDPMSAMGKVLRLKDDGTVPMDNPFVGKAGYRPEIYSLGHRDHLGLFWHPSGQLFQVEHGPNGGDEMNIIRPGRNYGWPISSFGRQYPGQRVSEVPWKEGIELPQILWVPSIGPSGLLVYSGDTFPAWKGNLFVGSAQYGEVRGTGHLQRVVMNPAFEDIRRERLLDDLHQRVRDVRQGPDGNIYVLTDQEVGAVLVIEPAP
jgi:glucose/arabinose dehydrogenase